MRAPRRVAAVALSTTATLASGIFVNATADADAASVLYVNKVRACTDTGPGAGAAATPFCTIQAAASAALPGDTVQIEAGTYVGPVTIGSVGTAAAPIVFQANGLVQIVPTSRLQVGPSLVFSGARYVTFEGAEGIGDPQGQEMSVVGVEVGTSTHVTLDGMRIWPTVVSPRRPPVTVDGTSSAVTISRSGLVNGQAGVTGVQIDSGSSDDVVTTDYFQSMGTGVTATGAPGTVITSNSFVSQPTDVGTIVLAAGSTGSTVENNVMGDLSSYLPSAAEISVDAASSTGTTVDYNVIEPSGVHAYSWDGVDYDSVSAFAKGSNGQGAHDLMADPGFEAMDGMSYYFGAPQENSANSAAAGMLNTDALGNPCTGNPLIPVTGAGSPAYCARGAFQPSYTFTTSATVSTATAKTARLTSSVAEAATNGDPSNPYYTAYPAVSYTINWGDGRTQTVQASSTSYNTVTVHTYAHIGTYKITQTANPTVGAAQQTTASVTTNGSGYVPFGPKRLLDTRSGLGAARAKVATGHAVDLKVANVDGIPANVTAVAVNLTATDTTANGYVSLGSTATNPQTSTLNYGKNQTVSNAAIVPVNADGGIGVVNSGAAGGAADLVVDVTGYFVRGSGSSYTTLTPKRVLDTRIGTGAPSAKVGANTGLPVTIVGADSIPSSATAVALHVTVLDTTGSGWIAAEPYGAGTPDTSILNYLSGQTLSTSVIVPIVHGRIELYNGGGSTPVDLRADVTGFFSPYSPAAYMPVAAFRALDYRTAGLINPDTAYEEYLAKFRPNSSVSYFPPGATMVVNLTAAQEQQGGYIADYPWATARPGTSALNFQAGQTVAGLSLVGTAGPYQSAAFYNASPGYTGLTLDVSGYFGTR